MLNVMAKRIFVYKKHHKNTLLFQNSLFVYKQIGYICMTTLQSNIL